jgi:hypothetical protein
VLTEGKQRNQQIFIFFALALISFILSTLLYKASLEIWPEKAYGLGESSMAALTSSPLKILLTAVNPYTYWSAFKAWTYPYPFHYTLPLGSLKPKMAMIVMLAWLGITGGAIVTELLKCQRNEKRDVWLKWFWVLVCLSFGALFIIADSPIQVTDHRPHITITFVGVYIFAGAYALQVLSSSYRILNTAVVKIFIILLVALTAFGAQSGLLRGIVDIRQAQIDFIRTELSSKSPSEYRKIVVVLPLSSTCIAEPCEPWLGSINYGKWHETRKGRYQYALATLGIAPQSKEIVFVDSHPQQVGEDELLVDWKKYVAAREQHLNYLINRHLQ